MNENLIFDFIKEFTKAFNELKKKNKKDLNIALVNCQNSLNSLKENIKKKNDENIEENKLSISINFIEIFKQVVNLKYNKYYGIILNLLKKFIEYNLLSKEKSNNIIELIDHFYNKTKKNEELQLKVIEVLETLIFASFFEMKYDNLTNIYILILNYFNKINHYKNIDFKYPIRLIFSTLTEKIYSSTNFELIIKITVFIFSWYNLTLQKKIENINKRSSNEINIIISEINLNTIKVLRIMN